MKKLLTSKETPVYETINEKGKSSIFLTCDHASYKIPEKLAGLGLQENITETHIGWDIGALDVAKSISHAIDAPLFFTNYSRLVIDCNRPPLGNDSIPESIHGIRIPGNSDLSENELNQRVKEIFDPYHQAIDESISYHRSIKERINLLAVHSFTLCSFLIHEDLLLSHRRIFEQNPLRILYLWLKLRLIPQEWNLLLVWQPGPPTSESPGCQTHRILLRAWNFTGMLY